MGINRNRFFQSFKIDQSGQSTVEYIMLFAMIAILLTTVYNSDAIKKIFGKEGTFAKTYKEEIEFSYRHAHRGRKPFQQPNYSNNSHSSYSRGGGSSRFFGAVNAYPK